MLEPWVWWTLLAASMQSVRTAGQKYLTSEVSPLAATLVRYLFGLPFVFLYLFFVLSRSALATSELREVNLGFTFFLSATLAGILQIVATVLLVRLFSMRNFAVGSTYIRTEIVITAILAMLFFSESISFISWVAIVICVSGLIVINTARSGRISSLWNQSALFGLASGLCFSLTSLFLRQASLSLENPDSQYTAAMTLAYMVSIQTLITFAYVYVSDRPQIRLIMVNWRPSVFVGITSVLGSIGWFTAMTIERAALVKTVGQVEIIFTLLISIFFFREIPARKEIAGMLLIIGSVIVLLVN